MECDGVRPGSIFEDPGAKVTESPNASLPVNSSRTVAPAALKLLCPEMYSGNGGVGNVPSWQGIQNLPSMVTVASPGPPHA